MTKNNSLPLAARQRPKTIAEVIGQDHLLKNGEFLHGIIKSKKPVSMILWGPPGSGKTTLARIVAEASDYDFIEISAVIAGLPQVREVIARAQENRKSGKQTLLFVDEIHRFNKAQQDAFLPHVESGLITFIGATTENPSFEVIGPLLSRSRVVVLEPIKKADIVKIIKRALKDQNMPEVSVEAIDLLAELSAGDARMALGGLEVAAQLNTKEIGTDDIKKAMQTSTAKFDKGGEYHYNLISAYIKSMRGSDVDATLYYLARLLKGGEDPRFIARRNVVFASEDIGIAAPAALNLAVSTFMAVERVGMPECQYGLFECAIVLAKSKKSRAVADAMSKSFDVVGKFPDSAVPLHLRNAPTKLMKDLGYGKGTKWEPGFVHEQGFLPEELKSTRIFTDDEYSTT